MNIKQMEMDVICKTWFCPALSSEPDHFIVSQNYWTSKLYLFYVTRSPGSVPGIFMFQQTEFNFYGESFKFMVMSEVKSVHNEEIQWKKFSRWKVGT